jgi:hypothetical protein
MQEEKFKYRYVLARFVPNQLRGEFINVGVVMHNLSTGELSYKWLPNLGRMRYLSKEITLEEYKSFQNYLGERFLPNLFKKVSVVGQPVTMASPELLDYFRKELGGQFQFSEPTFGYTTDPEKQLERLYKLLVEETIIADEDIEEVAFPQVSVKSGYPDTAFVVVKKNHTKSNLPS